MNPDHSALTLDLLRAQDPEQLLRRLLAANPQARGASAWRLDLSPPLRLAHAGRGADHWQPGAGVTLPPLPGCAPPLQVQLEPPLPLAPECQLALAAGLTRLHAERGWRLARAGQAGRAALLAQPDGGAERAPPSQLAARVLSAGAQLAGFDWAGVAALQAGRWTFCPVHQAPTLSGAQLERLAPAGGWVERGARHAALLAQTQRSRGPDDGPGVSAFVPVQVGTLPVDVVLVAAQLGASAWTPEELVLLDEVRLDLSHHLTRSRRVEELEVGAWFDPLTRIRNRRAFDVRLDELEAAGAGYAVVMLDLDGFKQLNDELGHLLADEALCAYAMRLHSRVAPYGDAYRWGGDEFALLLSRWIDGQAPLLAWLERLALGGPAGALRGSFGVAWRSEAASASACLRLADERMYARKRAARPAPPAAERGPDA